MSRFIVTISFLCFLFNQVQQLSAQESNKYFKIRLIDQSTGRGIPLVELRTTNNLSFYTDNNGIIAFYEPGLMNQEVYFHIRSHGYEYPKDGFEYRGKSLKTIPGDTAIIKIKRINIAERLYRITGEGLYNNSLLAGFPVPLRQPLNGKVLGQDTFIETLYKGKMYWFWGDTDRPSYPLGNFSTSGATSELPGKGGLDPGIGVNLAYFTDDSGFSKKMCPVPGPGPVWIHWLTTIKDSSGIQQLIASYTRVKSLSENLEQGLALFNDSAEIFEPIIRFDLNSPFFPDGQSFRATFKGQEYIYFDFSFRYPMRVLADLNHIRKLSSYEVFTCLTEGSRYDTSDIKLDRTKNGKLLYDWKINTDPLNFDKEKYLLKKGELKPGESWMNLCDFLTGDPIVSKSGSVFWNEYRSKWVMVFEQIFGTSYMGEVWYAEGDTPTGPWVYARKIVTHDNYTFYNVGQHPLFDQDNGRLIYFEGTYTNSFSGNPVPTPRYNYNQIMYRLDLSDLRLCLPSPVYRLKDNKLKFQYFMRKGIDSLDNWELIQEIPFFALSPDRRFDGLIPVYEILEKGKPRLQVKTPDHPAKALFFVLPDTKLTDTTIDGTWECEVDGFFIELKLQATGTLIEGTTNEESLIIKKGSIRKDTIELFIEDTRELRSYVVKALVTGNNLYGECKDTNDDKKSIFSGKHIVFSLQQLSSPLVVPLYEYRDKDGYYSYSIQRQLVGFTRSEKPVCRVWRNPSSLLTLDFETKPVLFTK